MSSQYASTEPTWEHLQSLPDLCIAQADTLKIDTGRVRYWVSRAPGSRTISVEHLVAGCWIVLRSYCG